MSDYNLYIEYFHLVDLQLFLPLKSLLTLFVCRCCGLDDLKINLLQIKDQDGSRNKEHQNYSFSPINIFDYTLMEITDCATSIRNSVLPAIHFSEDCLCIAGLCAVLRQILKCNVGSEKNGKLCKELLGFRMGCLMACAEVSIWTKFCEIDVPASVDMLFSNISESPEKQVCIPIDVLRFEKHLAEPLKIHNVHKRQLDAFKQGRGDDFAHYYAEGMDMMLSDVLVFSCFYLISIKVEGFVKEIENVAPNVSKWFTRMRSKEFIQSSIATVKCDTNCKPKINSYVPENINGGSLYIRDPKRSKPKSSGDNYQKILQSLLDSGSVRNVGRKEDDVTEFVDWPSLPRAAQPIGGDLPEKRLRRKCEQLDSMIQEICNVAKSGDTIVDFCSGGGHLGIPLAYLLPSCHVILIDNKESSIRRARDRIYRLKLPNVTLYQGNLDYYKGHFDVGVALHACGVATDLVIQRSIDERACFVCCPCCYGFIEDTHLITYPRSATFRSNGITYEDHLLLCHYADQTEEKTTTYEKGKLCMKIIDSDRLFLAEENGYDATLTTLNPPSCTPKNHVIVGKVRSNQRQE